MLSLVVCMKRNRVRDPTLAKGLRVALQNKHLISIHPHAPVQFALALYLLGIFVCPLPCLKRYQETDTRDKKRNEELTEEFRRITKQYNDMQAKFRHFEISDNNRYEQVGTPELPTIPIIVYRSSRWLQNASHGAEPRPLTCPRLWTMIKVDGVDKRTARSGPFLRRPSVWWCYCCSTLSVVEGLDLSVRAPIEEGHTPFVTHGTFGMTAVNLSVPAYEVLSKEVRQPFLLSPPLVCPRHEEIYPDTLFLCENTWRSTQRSYSMYSIVRSVRVATVGEE